MSQRDPFVTLALRRPRMDTSWVLEVQKALSNWRGYWPNADPQIDGVYGPHTAQAAQTWLWRFGAPDAQVRPALSPLHQLYLLGYRGFPSDWRARRLARAGKPVPHELRYLAPAEPEDFTPLMVPRSEWSRDRGPGRLYYTKHGSLAAVIHWNGLAAGARGGTGPEVDQLRQWRDYHMNTNGWSYLGYGWAIGMSGTIYEGRGLDRKGSHSGLLGNFRPGVLFMFGKRDDNGNGFTYEQLRSAEWLREHYGWSGWKGHRELSSTECPGAPLQTVIRNNRGGFPSRLWEGQINES